MNTIHAVRGCVVAAAALSVVSAISFAGDIDPPSGAVAPTMKTLDEVEPRIPLNLTNTPGDLDSLYRITEPGSYYLTEDTAVRSSESGIEVVASNVTIDLMGYRIHGLSGAVSGIRVLSSQSKVTIRNGSIHNFDSDGIDAFGVHQGVFENITVSASMGYGIRVSSNCLLVGCVATANQSEGFRSSTGTVFRDCTASGNTGAGFLGTQVVMIGCTATENGTDGFRGYGVFSQCLAWDNGSNGFEVNDAGTLEGCCATNNSEHGFHLSNGAASLINCAADSNTQHGYTFVQLEATTFVGCSADGNDLSGFDTPPGSTLEACISRNNGGYGFTGGFARTIRGCSASNNALDGIRVTAKSFVFGNTCYNNGMDASDGAGILATSSGNRIEANNVTDNDRGIDVDSAGNLVIRNSCSGNAPDYDIAVGNTVGPIITSATIATDSNPHANYEF